MLRYKRILLIIINLFLGASIFAQKTNPLPNNTFKYPIFDRRTPIFENNKQSPYNLLDTNFIKQHVFYNPITKEYYVDERIQGKIYRQPLIYNRQEFLKKYNKQSEIEYFQLRNDILNKLNRKVKRPEFVIDESFYASPLFFNSDETNFGRLGDQVKDVQNQIKSTKKAIDSFKLKAPELKFQLLGDVTITAGYVGVRSFNPNLAPDQRNVESFDFKPTYNLNANVSLGDNFKLPFNLTNLNNLNFDNQIKLSFKGRKNQIIKSIDAGNINYQSKSVLIPSTQNLFGLKTRLQFGKLYATAVLATQNSNKEALQLNGGSSIQRFKKRIDDYDENKHFLLGQYFREHFSEVYAKLPQPNSQVVIQRLEIWVTNRNNTTNDARYVTALMDLGEAKPYNQKFNNGGTARFPDNNANSLYNTIQQNPNVRNPDFVSTQLQAMGLQSVAEFEKVFGRRLTSSEYYFNQQAGFISLNIQLLPDDVLGVAYQFSYNGKVYQVGEFANDVNPDTSSGVQKVIFLKMLKATAQRVDLPIWDLMMKNVYSLDFSGNIERTDFQLNVFYSEPGAGLKRYLPVADAAVSGQTLLKILNLDNLNTTNNPPADGLFDFVEGYTILLNRGKIIFPFLEPFGKDLENLAFKTQPQDVRNRFLFYDLYDSLKYFAQNSTNVNRFEIEGQAKGVSGEFTINAFNIPQGSVHIQIAGYNLIEGQDFVIDYGSGRGRIINPAYINNASTAIVTFENSVGISTQQKNFSALRLDYVENKDLTIGFSAVSLGGTPFFNKLNYGDDPILNSVYGLDVSYRGQSNFITQLINKVLFIKTKAPSFFSSYAEVAYFKPSHPVSIGTSGTIYIDDFESSATNIDMKEPFTNWTMASVPQGQASLFPEGNYINDLRSGFNRSKLAWYKILPILQTFNDPNNIQPNINPLRDNFLELNNPRVRRIYRNELFPNVSQLDAIALFQTFDLAYYPMIPGPYNLQTAPTIINQNGLFIDPTKTWGGIMRSIDQIDFETNNIEYIDFWLLNPYQYLQNNGINSSNNKGVLYINLGTLSEDVLNDGKRQYEQGLPTPNNPTQLDSSVWGFVPFNPIQVINTFSNDPNDREFQDLGFDGMSDELERRFRSKELQQYATNFGVSSAIYQKMINDPSNDNYEWFLDPKFDGLTGILRRYQNFNNMQGNSPVVSSTTNFLPQATIYPDIEDLNKDNTLNQNEAYFQYQIPISFNMEDARDYIYNVKEVPVFNVEDNRISHPETWYQFRIPIKKFNSIIGNIKDFKSIRYIRMFLKGFSDTTVMRFATMNFLRNNWRPYTFDLDTNGNQTLLTNTATLQTVGVVNIFEHSQKQPVNYLVPPGIQQQQIINSANSQATLNEQALAVRIDNLPFRANSSVFKTVSLDLRRYRNLSMFIHVESKDDIRQVNLQDNELQAVIRIGQDAVSNFYEIKMPLKVTPAAIQEKGGFYIQGIDDLIVWPLLNNLDLDLQNLVTVKLNRNRSSIPQNQIFRQQFGNMTISILGNPNIAEVNTIILGVENISPKTISCEVWFNELRLTNFVEDGAFAGLAKMDATIADVGTVNFSISGKEVGFGSVDQSINQRSLDNIYQLNFTTNLELGRFLPKGIKMNIPVVFSYNNSTLTPKYDPFDKDVTISQKLNSVQNVDSVRRLIVDQTDAINFAVNNMRIQSTKKQKPVYSLANFDLTYNYSQINHTNPTIARDFLEKHLISLGYTYAVTPKYIQPFKKMIPEKLKVFAFLHELNFNFIPSSVAFKINLNRQYGEFVPRIVQSFYSIVDRVDTTYNKFFLINNSFNIKFNITKSITAEYNAMTQGIVDEPYGNINTQPKIDSVWSNLLNGGRSTLYNQKFNVQYNLPFKYIPLLFWVNGNLSYNTSYNWLGASLNALELGNTISNDQQTTLNIQFNFQQIYSKSKYLNKVISNQARAASKLTLVLPPPIIGRDSFLNKSKGKLRDSLFMVWKKMKKDYKQKVKAAKIDFRAKRDLNFFEGAIGGFITMFRNLSINANERYQSNIPGYLGRENWLSGNFTNLTPLFGFAFGELPNRNWLNSRAQQGLFSRSQAFNLLITQSYSQTLNIRLLLEPIKHLTINLTIDRSITKQYSELFKDTLGNGDYSHLSALSSGSFRMSYSLLGTTMINQPINRVSELFNTFENNRSIVARRVAAKNPYWNSLPENAKFDASGFPNGYNQFAQEVLIPSFLAAYTGENASNIPLIKTGSSDLSFNPFNDLIPFPNWQINYSGLSQIPAIKKVFNNISFRNGYNSTIELGNFTSALLYDDPLNYGGPGFIDTLSGNYIPYFLIPNLTISESYVPFLGVDLTTKQFSLRFEYKKSRIFTLSLVDYQVSEGVTEEYNFSTSYQIRAINLGNRKVLGPLKSDFVARLDVTMRDSKRANSRLQQETSIAVEGQNDLLISPSIDFIINTNFNIKLFFEQRYLTPYVSNNFPTINTRAGFTLRYSFR